MAEQRLIDANNLGVGKANPDAFERKDYAYGWNSALQAVTEASPTIDPEKLPVVRQLMEENARLRNEVMRIRKFENLPMHTIIFEMKYADFMDAGRVEELAAEVLIGLMAKDAASRHPVKEVTL